MNIYEYQAKQLFAQYQIPVLSGNLLETKEQAASLAKNFSSGCVVKAQIYAGGRGKAGGVKICNNPAEIISAVEQMLGLRLGTHQNQEGQVITKLYLEDKCQEIEREYYLSLVLDRKNSCLTFIASAMGGVNIEEVAQTQPEKIIKVPIYHGILSAFHLRNICFFLGLDQVFHKEMHHVLQSMYKLAVEKDATQIEINPLVTTKSGKLLALDAKMNFDDNALFRHQDIKDLADLSQETDLDRRAKEFDLNYIKLDGEIGCMVNGAGLAMATMDIISLHGKKVANFLDVGGGSGKEKILEAFRIILSDSNVKKILVNIFGGIVRCDMIAESIIHAASELEIKIPIVVRLDGTNAEEGMALLAQNSDKIKVTGARNLAEAVEKVIQA
ncbi:Succinate--CoA ligase subunit beta [Rickettsiales endosymbiont of Paramecium tredecaurelia]|uniref:ADP-forming succinate--CoA ligase subunit beta n=1 Tax=Candidatus Sarmatiella mevalonica TaxID=2770581 RepID=UPI001921EEE3|nr:ADP-forming succinate--CoA ligase subunit beta [Candidatus Sarmatiella mevalonica]MBL3285076.1 Succinate--CoA ligase subunit beta [Candidatus Sarmatiella mevalonica]